MEGNVITYKAKLIAKGYYQRQRIDYDEVVNLLAMLKSKRDTDSCHSRCIEINNIYNLKFLLLP